MINLSEYKIIKFTYELSNEELIGHLWDKMNFNETRWATQLTLEGIYDTSDDDEEKAWDMFLLEGKLQNKIEEILKKYDIKYVIDDKTNLITENISFFREHFIKNMNDFLEENTITDNVLDSILEHGMDNITPLEKYYLSIHKEQE